MRQKRNYQWKVFGILKDFFMQFKQFVLNKGETDSKDKKS